MSLASLTSGMWQSRPQPVFSDIRKSPPAVFLSAHTCIYLLLTNGFAGGAPQLPSENCTGPVVCKVPESFPRPLLLSIPREEQRSQTINTANAAPYLDQLSRSLLLTDQLINYIAASASTTETPTKPKVNTPRLKQQ
jgi:hypothetical protein